jgi:hypothetical protein
MILMPKTFLSLYKKKFWQEFKKHLHVYSFKWFSLHSEVSNNYIFIIISISLNSTVIASFQNSNDTSSYRPQRSCQIYTTLHHKYSVYFFFILWGGTAATTGLLYQPRMMGDGHCGEKKIGGIKIGRGNRSTRRKRSPVPLCPPQIPHDYTQVWTRAAAVGSQRLTAWAMPRP